MSRGTAASTTTGVCFGLPQGTITVQVYVSSTLGGSDCFTGFNAQHWMLQAEEIY